MTGFILKYEPCIYRWGLKSLSDGKKGITELRELRELFLTSLSSLDSFALKKHSLKAYWFSFSNFFKFFTYQFA